MKLHLAQFAGQNAFTGYGAGYVLVNGERFERSLIVLPDRLITDWTPRTSAELTEADLAFLATLAVDIVLLGTGARLCFPPPGLAQTLPRQGIGLEVMDSQAAARTYNILLAEGRRVAAAVML
ncbi:Mth938-like domain-containing protein [Thiobacter aerophilum]|uniref:Mth938-like domain-containing protein n=1 Tax=Thiobacter aerophilum TaxID=3121275 RepID=A0ABV0EEC8_9BURK